MMGEVWRDSSARRCTAFTHSNYGRILYIRNSKDAPQAYTLANIILSAVVDASVKSRGIGYSHSPKATATIEYRYAFLFYHK
jgi:hypothetical protein